MDIGISQLAFKLASSDVTLQSEHSSFIPNEMLTFYVTPSSVLVRERWLFPSPFIPHSCRLFRVGFFFLFRASCAVETARLTTAGCLWLMVLSSALPAAVLTGCGIHSDSKQGRGVVISCPRSVLSLWISPQRPAKPDSSDSVSILQGNNCITARILEMLSFKVEKKHFSRGEETARPQMWLSAWIIFHVNNSREMPACQLTISKGFFRRLEHNRGQYAERVLLPSCIQAASAFDMQIPSS